jgi:hypothetical protein
MKPTAMRGLFSASAFAFVALSFAQFPGATVEPVPSGWRKGFEAIKIEDAKSWLGVLAGSEFEGRGSGQPGFMKAAEFMAARMKEFGLKPGGDNGTYFHDVPWVEGLIEAGSTISVGAMKLEVGEKMTLNSAPKTGQTSLKVILLSASGSAAKLDAGMAGSLKGKLVFANLFAVGRDFRRQLAASGAAGVIEVSELITAPRNFRSFGQPVNIRGRVHPDQVEGLQKELGISFAKVEDGEAKFELADKSAVLDIKGDIDMKMVPNVVGILEGSDPVLKSEFVGIGAHLDHLGYEMINGQKVVYPGADDDGSGCTALIGAMKAFQTNPEKPKRSIVFMAFTGEEMGLIGSSYLVNNPPFDLTKMVCLLQMDMVGRDADGEQNGTSQVEKAEENRDTMRLVGIDKHSTEFKELVLDTNKYIGFRFKFDRDDVYTRSDHYVFAAKGIPVSFSFVGFHPDYHRPTDTIEKINFVKVTNTAKFNYLLAFRAASRDAKFQNDLFKPIGG